MNFNVYISDQLYQELENLRQVVGKSRNGVINEALAEWVEHHKQQKWPKNFFKFDYDMTQQYPDIKELRKNLSKPKEDLL